MSPVEVLNVWGAVWEGFMTRALVDASALLAMVLMVWLPLRRRMSAQLAHGLFCLVLLKLFIPVPVTWPAWVPALSVRQAAEWVAAKGRSNEPSPGVVSVATPPEPLVLPTTGDLGVSLADATPPQPIVIDERAAWPDDLSASGTKPARVARPASLSFPAWLMLGWAFLSLLLLARFVRALLSTRRLIREAVPLGSDWLPIDVEALRRAAGVRASVRWAVSPKLCSPAVGGLVRPTVVIPPDLDDGLTPKQLTWVLLHELAHVRRGDLWMVVIQRIVQSFYFFHPAVHVASRIIDQLREYACDDVALAACKSSRYDCGEGFLTVVGRTVERVPTASPALGLFESRMLIRRRLLRILDHRRQVHERLSPRATVGLLAVALVVLPYGRARDASAHLQSAAGSKSVQVEPREAMIRDLDEPASYRPGAVWHRLATPEEAATSARVVVLALVYSPDGAILASAGEDGTVLLRDPVSGRVLRRLEGHGDAVSCLAFSPDGRTLVSGGYDRTVRLWDVASGREKAMFTGHANWVFAVAFAPDGASIASAGHDQTVRVWDVALGRESARLSGHGASVRALAFAPDGKALASAGADRTVVLWDLRTKAERARLKGHRGTIRALAFAPGGDSLATAGEDSEVRLWDVAEGRERALLSGHADMVVCLAYSPRGGTLATGSLDATVKLWDARTGRERVSLQGHNDGVSALAFAPGAQRMATGSFDGSVRLWEPAAPIFSPAACLAYPGETSAVAFDPDGRALLATGRAGIARWDARTGSALAKVVPGEGTALAVAPDGATYATAGLDGTVRLIDVSSGLTRFLFNGPIGPLHSVAFSPSGRLLASGGQDGIARLWDVNGRRLLVSYPKDALPIRCIRFSPDGRWLASATGDEPGKTPGVVTLREIATGNERGVLRGHTLGLMSVAFSADGKSIATAGADGVVKLWDAATLSLRNAVKYAGCLSVAFSPDSRYLASAHLGGDVVLWDAASGRQLGLLKGHREGVAEVVFSPDGRSLATAGKDRTVKLWNLAARRQRARATFKGDLANVWSVSYAPDGKTLAVADGNADAPGTITLWELAARRVKATLEGHERGVVSTVFSPDGRSLASGSWDGTIRLWDVESGTQRYELAGLNGVTDLAFSPDGTILASAGEGKVVALWNVETGAEVARLTDFRWRVQCVAFSPDGRFLATGGGAFENKPDAQGEVKLWNVATKSVVAALEGHERAVLTIAFAPDGSMLATGGVDQTVRLWDLPANQLRFTLSGLPNCVQAVAFSRDGRRLAWSGRNDGLVALHDTRTGAEVVRLVGHGAVVRGIAFGPDGSTLATGGADRTIKLWDVPAAASSLSLNTTR